MASRITTMFAAAGLAVVLPFGASAAAFEGPAPSAASSASAPHGLAATAAAGTSTFGIQPVPHSNTDTRAAFAVSATPGAKSSDAVRVSNFGDQAVTLHIYASDAVNTPEGGYDLKPSGTRPTDVGTWVAFGKQQLPYLTIPSKTFVDLPFTLTVPANATPGDHAGGIVAALTTPSLDSHGNRINIEQRVGTRIYVRVAGALKAQLSVQQLGITYHDNWNPFGSGSATVTYKVTNTGNVRLSAKPSVHVTTLFGGTVQAGALKNSEQLLPGNSLLETTTVSGVTPAFMVTAHVSVDPAAVPGDLDPQVLATSASASTVAIPWIWLVILVLIAGFGFEVFRQRRRASRPGAPAAVVKNGAAKNGPVKNNPARGTGTAKGNSPAKGATAEKTPVTVPAPVPADEDAATQEPGN